MKNYFIKLLICKAIIPLFLLPILLFGQGEVLLFKSLEDYKNDRCTLTDQVFIEKRENKDIKSYGGSDYKAFASDWKLLKMIEKYYWGVLKNDSLFVNCKQLGLATGYAYAEQIDSDLFLILPANAKYNTSGKSDAIIMREALFGMGMIGGVVGWAIGASIESAAASSNNKENKIKYIYYVLSMEKGNVKRLNKRNMVELLSFNEELIKQYLNEADPKNANTQRKYLIEYQKSLE